MQFDGEFRYVATVGAPRQRSGRNVLVVGAGNSGVEWSEHLVRRGAVRLSVRHSPNLLPREIGRLPLHPLAVALERLPIRFRDLYAGWLRRATIGDLSAYGLPLHDEGPYRTLARTGVTVAVDTGFANLVRDGRIRVVSQIDAVTPREVVLADGSRLSPHVVLAATGMLATTVPPVCHHLVMTPKARIPVQDESEGVRERILAAAMNILREEGIQGLSQVQVARKAEVRQSHLTYYFPKRNDLIEAVAMRFIEHAFGALDLAAAAATPDDLSAVLLRAAAAIADEGHMRMFTAVLVEADGNAELRVILVKVTKQLQATLASRLTGEDAMERARLVLASLWGMGLYDFLMRPRRRSPLVESLLACLGAPRP